MKKHNENGTPLRNLKICLMKEHEGAEHEGTLREHENR
jgi:hypothetical protein